MSGDSVQQLFPVFVSRCVAPYPSRALHDWRGTSVSEHSTLEVNPPLSDSPDPRVSLTSVPEPRPLRELPLPAFALSPGDDGGSSTGTDETQGRRGGAVKTVLLHGLPKEVSAGMLRALTEEKCHVRVPNTSVYCTEAELARESRAVIETDSENEALLVARTLNGFVWRGKVLSAWIDKAFQHKRVLFPVKPVAETHAAASSGEVSAEKKQTLGIELDGKEDATQHDMDMDVVEDDLPTSSDVVNNGSFFNTSLSEMKSKLSETQVLSQSKTLEESGVTSSSAASSSVKPPEEELSVLDKKRGFLLGKHLIRVKKDPTLVVCHLNVQQDSVQLNAKMIYEHFAHYQPLAVVPAFGCFLVSFKHRSNRDKALASKKLRILEGKPLIMFPYQREPEFVLKRITADFVMQSLRQTVLEDVKREMIDSVLYDLLHLAPIKPIPQVTRRIELPVEEETKGHLFDDLTDTSESEEEEEEKKDSMLTRNKVRERAKKLATKRRRITPRTRRSHPESEEEEEESEYDEDDDDFVVDDDEEEIEEEEEELERPSKHGVKRDRQRRQIVQQEDKKHKKKDKHKHKHKHRHHHRKDDGDEGDSHVKERSLSPLHSALNDDSLDEGSMTDEDAFILSSLSSGRMHARQQLTGFDPEDNEFLYQAWKEQQNKEQTAKQESSEQVSMEDQDQESLPPLEELYGALPTISPFVGNVTKSGCIRTEPYTRGKKPLLILHGRMRFSSSSIAASAVLASAASIPGTPAAVTAETSKAAALTQAMTLARTQIQEQNEQGAAAAAAAVATTVAGAGRAMRIQRRAAAVGYAGPFTLDESIVRQKKVVFERSKIHGWGLFAMERIPANDFIIEYVGELVRNTAADVREQRYTEGGEDSSYMFRLDEFCVVDATHKGNCARFINHSCEPNAYARTRELRGKKSIVIYSLREIAVREEITFDYKFDAEDAEHKLPCYCGAPNCRGFLN